MESREITSSKFSWTDFYFGTHIETYFLNVLGYPNLENVYVTKIIIEMIFVQISVLQMEEILLIWS